MLGTVGAAVVVPGAAQAVETRLQIGTGYQSCPLGYVCLWTQSNYTGSGYAFYNSESNYATLPLPFRNIQDYSWSFYNNGQYNDIRFFLHVDYSGHSFILCKQRGIPELPPNTNVDPSDLTYNGHGWRDRVSSHKFGNYC